MSESEDDSLGLSREALTALQEFYTQQAEKDKKLQCILDGKEHSLQHIQFDEDWARVFCNYITIEFSWLLVALTYSRTMRY
jgi:hypothetical protein